MKNLIYKKLSFILKKRLSPYMELTSKIFIKKQFIFTLWELIKVYILQNLFFQRSIICGLFFSVFLFPAFAKKVCQGGQTATTKEKPRFCFFSFNGEDESKGLCRRLWELETNADADISNKNCETLPVRYRDKIEIKEYYADTLSAEPSSEKTAPSVEDQFREMTNEQCSALMISGLHAGYFTGKKTDPENRSPSHSALTLDFLEKFSCHNDENCKAWFNGIKMLHLHGAQTWGVDSSSVQTKNTDQRMKELREDFSEDEWNSSRLAYLNREYANTVDKGNPLSHRYLRIFPNASVLAWSDKSVTIENDSLDTLLAHFQNLSKAYNVNQRAGEDVKLPAGFNAFLNFLNPDTKFRHEDVCEAWERVDDRYEDESVETKAGFITDAETNDKARELGCAFSNAVDSGNTEDIRTALLGSENSPGGILGESDIEKKKQYIHQNLNRFFRALHSKSPLEEEQKQEIISTLKESEDVKQIFEDQIATENLGVVRRADYLNLYQRIYGNTDQISNLEAGLFKTVNKVSEQNPDHLMTQEMLAEIVWKNQLGKTIPMDSNPDPIQEFVQNFQNQGSNNNSERALALEKQALLVQASAGRVEDSDPYKDMVRRIYDTDNGYNKAVWFIENLLRANEDFPFKEEVIDVYNAKLNKREPTP